MAKTKYKRRSFMRFSFVHSCVTAQQRGGAARSRRSDLPSLDASAPRDEEVDGVLRGDVERLAVGPAERDAGRTLRRERDLAQLLTRGTEHFDATAELRGVDVGLGDVDVSRRVDG